jgi:hypothetical protein
MVGSPFPLGAANASLCEAACNATPGCLVWSLALPSCGGSGSTPQCFLKESDKAWSADACRVSGDMGAPGGTALRPAINGAFTFLTGFLDQSWWPDGEYLAPSDEALKFDLQLVKSFGMNVVRLHQKVNPQRFYYWADVVGIAILQDMPQKYGAPVNATRAAFASDLRAMLGTVYNHPSVIQYTLLNEEDCTDVFTPADVAALVSWIRDADPSRLVDADSGGVYNPLHLGDVNDQHAYPWPAAPAPSATQYSMDGEFSGIGLWSGGAFWQSGGGCSFGHSMPSAEAFASTYIEMLGNLTVFKHAPGLSAAIATQTTDIESECDGFVAFDRSSKFDDGQVARIRAANLALVAA